MTNGQLDRMKDTGLAFGESENDIRGHSVVDASGGKVGNVEALYVDENARRIRFVLVAGLGCGYLNNWPPHPSQERRAASAS